MTGGKIPFDESMLGMFSVTAAAVFLNIGVGQLRNYLNNGEIPERFAPRLAKMSDCAIIEIDEPPSAEVIGIYAYQAIMALRADDPKQALAWAEQGLQSNPFDYDLGGPRKTTLVQQMYASVARAMVIARNHQSSELREGLPALQHLHHKVVRHMKVNRITASHPEWQAWKYLRGMTTAYALAYYVVLIGKGWYVVDAARVTRLEKQSDYRKSLARIVIRAFLGDRDSSGQSLLNSVKRVFGKSPITTLAVWNLTQLAALADLPKSFVVCLEDLYSKFAKKSWPKMLQELQKDHDTGPMFATPPVREFLEQIAKAEALEQIAKAKALANKESPASAAAK